MISKNTIKQLQSLQNKKYRKELKLFIGEGDKLVSDLLNSPIKVVNIYHTNHWSIEIGVDKGKLVGITEQEMKKISGLSTQSSVLGVFKIPVNQFEITDIKNKLTLILDDIQDPGNLGTIIRLADWFGIDNIVCSKGTVDAFSPKVVQATMGAISRVKIFYEDIIEVLTKAAANKIDIFGTFMDGENIYQTNLPHNALVVMGNEGNGISQNVEKLVGKRLTIPNFAENQSTSESLNVATATAIVCSEFRRRLAEG
jgi:TrmH family RNA methyltransferase